jgi:outer membrane protein TolC
LAPRSGSAWSPTAASASGAPSSPCGGLAQREEASEAALRLALDRYLQGLSDYLPVLTAQGLYFEVQSQTLSARRQLLADRITLARALGGEWMENELERGM